MPGDEIVIKRDPGEDVRITSYNVCYTKLLRNFFMRIPLQITWRELPASAALETAIREKAAKLDEFCDDIMGCHVLIESPLV